jgi:hypothetical protein
MGWRRSGVDGDSMAADTNQPRVVFMALLVSVIATTSLAVLAQPSAAASPSRSWLPVGAQSFVGGRGGWRAPFARSSFVEGNSWRSLHVPAIDRAPAYLRAFTPAVSPAVSGGTGQISGKVTSAATNAAIAGIGACAIDDEPPFSESCATTNASGEYTIAALAAGEYYLVFYAPSGSGLDFVTQYYDESARFSGAEPVSVGAGEARAGIDAKLLVGGGIAGTVTSAATTKPLANVEVCAFDEELEAGGCTSTSPTGTYEILGLPKGSYDVEFSESEGEGNYATQYYKGKSSLSEAEAVSVVVESVKSGIDAALVEGAQITGRVTSFSSGAPLEGIVVCALPVSEGSFGCSSTDARGEYDVRSLSSARYIVVFESPSREYATQFYDEASSFEDARQLSIEAGTTTESIDAVLHLAPPTIVSSPTISGSAVEGQVLTVSHGNWTGNPSSYRDEWFRCEPGAEYCYRVAEGESYTPTSAVVGQSIFVRETAFNAAGASEFAYSKLTADVVAAPAQATTQSAPPPSPAVLLSGVLGVTTSVPSAAELKSLLNTLLAPTGKHAKIGAMLEHGGYTLSLSALSAGQLTISWYLVPKGAHLARAKPTLLARGHVTLSRAGAAKVTIELTGKGRAVLKHAHQLKLTARGTMTAVGGSTVSATRSFVLKR